MFSHLPSDIVAEILLFLSPDEIFPKCLVSRVFASVCRDEHFWRRVWLKWISPQLPSFDKLSFLRQQISQMVNEFHLLSSDPPELLFRGAKTGSLYQVKEALKLNVSRLEMNRALWLAVRSGHRHMVQYLVESGADISSRENRALRIAAEYGHLDVVQYLIEQGANVSTRDDYPLRIAASSGFFEIVKYLVKHGANISAQKQLSGYRQLFDIASPREIVSKLFIETYQCG